MDIALRCPRRVQRRNSFDCRCRSDILSARYCAGGDGAARRAYHRAKHVQRFIAGFGRAGGMSPGGMKEASFLHRWLIAVTLSSLRDFAPLGRGSQR